MCKTLAQTWREEGTEGVEEPDLSMEVSYSLVGARRDTHTPCLDCNTCLAFRCGVPPFILLSANTPFDHRPDPQ